MAGKRGPICSATSITRNWEGHNRTERNIKELHASVAEQRQNVDKLAGALRDLIDRIRLTRGSLKYLRLY